MPKSQILNSLEELDKPDIYSLLLFSIYKLYDVKEYSTLSELVYVLDKDNLYKFLSMYGGMTITVPKISELEKMLDALQLYSMINFDHVETSKAIKEFSDISYSQKELLDAYKVLSEVLSKYDFTQTKESENE